MTEYDLSGIDVLIVEYHANMRSLMRRVQGFASAIYFSVVLRGDMREVYDFKATEGPFALSLLIGLVMAQFFALHTLLLSIGW